MAEGSDAGETYRRVPPVPEAGAFARGRRRVAKERAWKKGERLTEMVDPGVLKPAEVESRDRSALQKEFDAFFAGIVSEWNPCYSEDGQCRYRWDAELGVPVPEVQVTSEE